MPKNKEELEKTRRGAFHWVNGVPYVSVTTALDIMDKPALRYWFGKQIFLAMVANPTLNEQEALAAPYNKSGEAKERGSTVHSIVETYKHTGEYIDSVPDKFKGYAKAFYTWVEDNDIEILEQERLVVSKVHNYAGILDLLVRFRKSGRVYVIDIKTGKDIYPEAYVQLSAYKNALEENGTKADETGVLLLQEDGSHKFGQGYDAFAIFLHCKAIWNWKNKEMVETIKKGVKNGTD